MNKTCLCTFLSLFFLLAGCQSQQIDPLSTQEIKPALTLPANTLTPTREPTSTISVIPTESSTSTVTPVIDEFDEPLKQCIDVASTLPDELSFPGTILLRTQASNFFLMNFDNGITELQKLPNERSAFYITSTDRKYVALRVVTIDEGASYPEKLVIINAQGERVYTTAWRDHWSSLLFFPDIEHLILSLDEINGHEIVSFFSPVPYTIFNIPTGKEQIYSYSFSGFVTNVYPVLPRWNTLHGLSYDPTLTRAIYPRDVDKNPDIFTYAIWDLENDSLMTTLDDVVYTYKPYIPRAPGPHWYADGSHFLVVGHVFSDELEDLSTTEVFRVSRDGVPEEITQLGRKFLVESHNISLSPDGRKVTLFLKANPSPKKAQLAILDLETLEIVDTCIRISTDDMINPPSPIWFPDGKQFLVFDKQNEEDSRVILVDIDQQRAAVIADDVEPVAWMLDK